MLAFAASLTCTSRHLSSFFPARAKTSLQTYRFLSNHAPLSRRPMMMARARKSTSSSSSDEGGYDHSTEKLITYCENQGVERELASQVLDMAVRSVRDWTVNASDFLTPPESAALGTCVDSMADAVTVSWGGYDDAERQVLFVTHADTVPDADGLQELAREQLVLLKIQGNFEFDKASHRDFMGAVLNAGVTRQKIGDIVVQDEQNGAHVIVHEAIAPFLQTTISTVRSVPVSVEMTSTDELQLPPKRVKEIQSVESSMRMDAVISAGFKISRSKLADMARSGLVYVNYKELRSPAKTVKSGDVVSVRGVGKLEIGECSTTAKGRYRIQMKKYV